jgi:hypothetical protein
VTWLATTLAMYRDVALRAGRLAVRNWPVLGTTVVYSLVLAVAALLAAGLGIAGGFLMSLVWASCVSSFLSLVENMVRSGRVSWRDFQRSFGAYLWDVVGVTFVLWIVFAVATPALRSLPQGPGLLLALDLLIVVLFNAVPELIYLRHASALDLLTESFAFISDNWIEWFPPNLVAGGVLYLAAQWPLDGVLAGVRTAVVALFVYGLMVFRGLLFLELDGTSRRGRAFRHRTGG